MHAGLRTLNLHYARNDQPLFQGLSLELLPGQGLLICGPNGSGKTTLLRVLAGLITPTSGSLQWQGRNLEADRLAYHQNLHFLGHLSGVKNKFTVTENLRYSETLANQRLSEEKRAAVLQAVRLLGQQDQLAQQLSAGQKRRLALARLLAFPKPLWILDEPFTNLDQDCQQWFRERLDEHLQGQGLVILASHQAIELKQQDRLQTLTLTGWSGGKNGHV